MYRNILFVLLFLQTFSLTALLLHPIKYIKSIQPSILTNKYAHTKAELRYGNKLHPEEYAFRKKRAIKVKSALEKITHSSLKNSNVPRISVMCSGGGCRAMLGTLGALSGLEKIGALDTVTYISALSGSTWALGLWMTTGMTLSELKKYVSQRLAHNMYHLSRADVSLMADAFATKIAYNQPCTTVDVFGGFLANEFLHKYQKDRQMVHLSDQYEQVKNGDMPFPIYTAVDGRRRVIGKAPWYEFTPLEIGSAHYGVYVPTWAYGRHFDKGVSVDDAPEQSLGFHFGIFGSAFALHAGHIWKRYEHAIKNKTIKLLIDKAFQCKVFSHQRLFWGNIANFMFGLENNAVKNNKKLKLVDAGLECNLPYLPISGERADRMPDVIICFDFSKNLAPSALKTVERYARERNLPFPVIDYTDIEKKVISVFKNEQDASIPIVIYMPRISDKKIWQYKAMPLYKTYRHLHHFDFEHCTKRGVCNTTNFHYSQRQSRQVMDQMECNVVANKDILIENIKLALEKNKSMEE